MRLAGRNIRRLAEKSLSFALALSVLCAPAFALDLKDATGTLVHVPEHPKRIVTLAPSVAELAAEFLGLDLQRIVGVSEDTDYPPALKKVESIGPYTRFNLERVVALKPDLVLATLQGNSKDEVLHLRELGIPVFVIASGSFSQVESAMTQMARLLGEPKKGKLVVDSFKRRLARIEARGKEHGKTPLRVLLQLDDDPLVVAGGKSFLNQALQAVGAKNVYADLHSGYPRPSLEDVLHRNPDFIVVIAFGPHLETFKRMAARWRRFPNLAAVQKNRIRVIYADTLLRPSMRLIEGLGILEKTLYGRK